jgi:glucose-6-phosphate 1-dehydrogenase
MWKKPRDRLKMTSVRSDAFVFFGATGDLAFKQIFPALQAMIRHGRLSVPIIGVARSAKGLDGLRARAHESLEKHGGVDPGAFAILSAKLQYVNGDYNSPETFRDLRKALGAINRGPLLSSLLDQHSSRFYFADTCQSGMTTVMLPRTNVALCEVRPA